MYSQRLIDIALSCGASKAVILEQEQIVLSAESRTACERGQCGRYGRCWMCPPHIGGIEDLMAKVRSFPRGVWFQTIHRIEDSFDIEGMLAAGARHAQVSCAIRAAMRPVVRGDLLLLSCGGCRICKTCAKETDEPCRSPERALPSLEGYGVDVYSTTKDTDLRYINGQDTVTYFGIALFKEETHGDG